MSPREIGKPGNQLISLGIIRGNDIRAGISITTQGIERLMDDLHVSGKDIRQRVVVILQPTLIIATCQDGNEHSSVLASEGLACGLYSGLGCHNGYKRPVIFRDGNIGFLRTGCSKSHAGSAVG